jgi:2'-5' RNA ligase
MKRTFIALNIDPGENIRRLLSELKSALSNSHVKWVDPENIHITLAFIGNTSEEDIDVIQQILKSSCKDHMSFPLIFQNVGVFKSISDPRIIWLGLKQSLELQNLRDTICSSLKSEGLYNDTRPFSPHLTLGRPKNIRDVGNLIKIISKIGDDTVQASIIENVIFYESILKQEGPVYNTIGKFRLAR